MSVEVRREGTVAFVTLSNPPVNAIGLEVRKGLSEALDWVNGQNGLSRVILSGSERAFAAGADAREFDADPVAPHLPDIVARIDACETPWVAAISGVALGGGCELALACRYRIASPSAKIGLPEVTLGVVPGAGGTQRLPRLVGLKAALDLVATGRPVSANRAEEIGLIHGQADDPVMLAQHLDLGTIALEVAISTLPKPTANSDAVEGARALAERKMPNQIAPKRAIDLIAASATMTLEDGMAQEREAFLALRRGDQAHALRHIFFAERGARAPDRIKGAEQPLDHVAVVGGGTMGAGIAYALLNAGLTVTLLETDAEGVTRANENVEKIVAASLKRRLISDADAQSHRAKFLATTDYGAAAKATLAIEAAFESMEVKKTIFGMLQTHLPANAILATNTSYLDVNEIAACVQDPSRVVGFHFFAPAHIMKLLEIVEGSQSSDAALATGFALAKRLRKIPVLSGVCDGFIGNRILARYREAADTVLLEGAAPWEVDEAMVEFGYAMGPYEAQDLSGLDIAHANRRRQDATRDPNRRYIPIADRMVELGKLGKKTGAGWYRYPGGAGKVEDPIVADLAIEEAHLAKVERREFTAEEIRERLLIAMINEAADILDEGIAASAADIDLVTVFGYGFPRWRGGLLAYADTLGASKILEKLKSFAQEDPLVWTPSPSVIKCAQEGSSFAQLFGKGT
ncbi:FAD-dependent oxidoreductase [uncultured Ruegeria sp.]|uniref:FAD-dependent oxidoreductase n=1 Tax=uncultured Ruegeria sp. TaxID=259304 RepID=UPI00262B6212|nr:FAD-dependent oxidoreductase [uncultured Ruegeria sp.]